MKKKYILSIVGVLVVIVFLGISFYSNVKRSRESLRYTKLGDELWDQALEKTDVTLAAQAIKAFERAIEINPKNIEASTALVVEYSIAGDYDKALSLAKRTVELNPRSVDARFFLADAYHDLGMDAEAQKEWKKILELKPDETMRRVALISLGKPVPKRKEALKSIYQDPEILKIMALVRAQKAVQKE